MRVSSRRAVKGGRLDLRRIRGRRGGFANVRGREREGILARKAWRRWSVYVRVRRVVSRVEVLERSLWGC